MTCPLRFGPHGFPMSFAPRGASFVSRVGAFVLSGAFFLPGSGKSQRRRFPPLLAVCLLVWLAGCAGGPRHFVPEPGADYSQGMFHRVAIGESLDEIARYYQRDLNLLGQFNDLSNSAAIYPGLVLYIPPSNDVSVLTGGAENGRHSQGSIGVERRNGATECGVGTSERRSGTAHCQQTSRGFRQTQGGTAIRTAQIRFGAQEPGRVSQRRTTEPKSARTVAATASPAPAVETRSASRSWRSRLFGDSKPKTQEVVVKGGSGQFRWPLDRFRRSRGFSTNWLSPHQGLDLAASEGTPIHASDDGVVLQSGRLGEYGNLVVLDHGGGYSTLYGHVSKSLVREGQKVRAGETIALVGSTGRSTGPHLHFEIRYNAKAIDPERKLSKPGRSGDYLVAQNR
jgi:murein DD-endopeptidase MepM/ murein hydrolase activator NlpD